MGQAVKSSDLGEKKSVEEVIDHTVRKDTTSLREDSNYFTSPSSLSVLQDADQVSRKRIKKRVEKIRRST